MRLTVALLCLTGSPVGRAAQSEIPLAPGVTFLLAINNKGAVPATAPRDIAQGDYEVVVAVTAVGNDNVTLSASFDAQDVNGERRQGRVTRKVGANDLQSAPTQILGFHTGDNVFVVGTTSLGPSRALVTQLLTKNTMPYAFRNFANQALVTGDLERRRSPATPFPVLINGVRTELKALHASGYMSAGKGKRPVELVILEHSVQPLLLRLAWGPVGASLPFTPEFVREVVRIDYAVAGQAAIEAAIKTDCRAEIPGIYFDFNQATLRAESRNALQHIATIVNAHPDSRFGIEGHTDGIGSVVYNDDLSVRRVAAVKMALVRDFSVADSRLWIRGIGERRPIDNNDTLAGRARNRRVELVRDCRD